MDEILKVIERGRNIFVGLGVALVGSFLVALIFSLDKPSDVLQAIASLLGAAISGGVAGGVAMTILKREERLARDFAANARQTRENEIKETEKALADWMRYALIRVETIMKFAVNLIGTTAEHQRDSAREYRAAVNQLVKVNLNAEILTRVGRDRPLLLPLVEDTLASIKDVQKHFSDTVVETPNTEDPYAFRINLRDSTLTFFVSWVDAFAWNVDLFILEYEQARDDIQPHLSMLALHINTAISIGSRVASEVPEKTVRRNLNRFMGTQSMGHRLTPNVPT